MLRIVSALMLLTFTWSGDLAIADPKVVRMAGIFDLSAAGKLWGIVERDSMLLAIEDFEREIPSVKVQYAIEDSAYSNTKVVSAFQKLVDVQGYRAVLGPTWEPFLVTAPLCERKKVICLSPSFSAPELAGLRFSFGLWYDNRGYVSALTPALSKLRGKIGVIAAHGPYYEMLVAELQQKFSAERLVVEYVGPDEQDFRTVLQRVNTKGIEGLVLYLNNGPLQSVLRMIKEIRLDQLKLFNDDTVLYFDPPPKGLGMAITITEPEIDAERAAQYRKKFAARFHREPETPSGAIAYDATRLLLQCLLNDADPSKAAKCLSAGDHQPGYSGSLDFAGSNMLSGRSFRSRVVDLR